MQQRPTRKQALWLKRFEREIHKLIARKKRERRQNVSRHVLEGGCVVLVPRYFWEWGRDRVQMTASSDNQRRPICIRE
jgi:hypothetical protein